MNLDYSQLLLLSIFALITGCRYLVSLLRGVRPVLILSRKKRAVDRAVEALPVAGVGLGALLVLRNIFTPQIYPLLSQGLQIPLFLQKTGFAAAFFSFGLLAAGYWALGNNWRVGIGDEETVELVTAGVFAYTRNPVYLFFCTFLGGLFLINGDYTLLFLFLVVTTSLHIQVLREEKALKNKYGRAYESYAKKVPRYLFRFR